MKVEDDLKVGEFQEGENKGMSITLGSKCKCRFGCGWKRRGIIEIGDGSKMTGVLNNKRGYK